MVYFYILMLLGVCLTAGYFLKWPSVVMKLAGCLFILTPIVYFYYIIYINTVNVPFTDDYNLLDTLYAMQHATTFRAWCEAFFEQVNQHRFPFERGMMWFILKIFGSENIKAQILVGDSFLIGIIFIYYKSFQSFGLRWYYFIPIPFLLFNLVFFENAYWGIAALQNTPIIFFAFLSVYLLTLQTNTPYFFAIITSAITMFISGNGLSIWIVGAMILIFQKRWKNVGIWAIVATLLLSFYFLYDYQFIQSSKADLIRHPFFNILFALAFWGNAFFLNFPHPATQHYYPDVVACILVGIILLIAMMALAGRIILQKKKYSQQNNWFLLGSMLFLMSTGLMLVLSRPVAFNVMTNGDVFSRRYMIFGVNFICLGYLSYVYLLKNKQTLLNGLFALSVFVGVSLNLLSYYTSLPDLYKQKTELELDGSYWLNHKMLLSFGEKYGDKLGWNHPTYMIDMLNRIKAGGLYEHSEKNTIGLKHIIENSETNQAPIFSGTVKIDIVKKANYVGSIVDRFKFTVTGSTNKGKHYLALKSSNNIFLLPLIPTANDLKSMFLQHSYESNRYTYETWRQKLPQGSYQIWLLDEIQNMKYKASYSGKNILF